MLNDDAFYDAQGAATPNLMEQISNEIVVGNVTGGKRQDLLANEVTQTIPASYNPKEISIDKAVFWQNRE